MTYEQKFDKLDFYGVVGDSPTSTGEICRRLACCRNTAKQYLEQLELSGKIKKITIAGSQAYGWVRV